MLAETLARFDALPVVTTQEMLGEWRGSGVPTGHDMDGLLEAYAWYGKSFVSEEVVHPLLFRNRAGETYAIDPRRIPLALSRGGASALHARHATVAHACPARATARGDPSRRDDGGDGL